jgi:hypothetical protein
MRALSYRPFYPCGGRWVSLGYLSAGCRYTTADITRIAGMTSTPQAVIEAVELFAAQAQAIAEAPAPPDVILCALPIELITRVVHETVIPDRDQDDEENDDDTTHYDFHDLLKARTNHLKRPLQLLWPTTWDETAKVARTLEKLSGRRV